MNLRQQLTSAISVRASAISVKASAISVKASDALQFPLFIHHDHSIYLTRWLDEVTQLSHQLKATTEQNWLLFEPDLHRFSVMFFALLTAQKHLILPPSDKQQQLEAIKSAVDATLGQAEIGGLPHLCAAQAVNKGDLSPAALVVDDRQTIDFFTSGSTGEAKKITKSWAQLSNEINDLEDLWGARLKNAVVVSSISHQHIYGLLFKLLWPLLKGRSILHKMISYPEELALQAGQQSGDIVLISSPAFLARTCQEPLWQAYADKFTTVFSSGGPLYPITAKTIEQQLQHAPIEVLGSTETGGIAWRVQTGDNGHLWQPFDKVTIRVDDDSHRLQIQSPYLTDQNWYTTDDRACIINQDQFELLTRADRIVKIEEKRLSLDELETRLNRHPWVQQSRALVLSGKREQVVVALVFTNEGKTAHSQHDKRYVNNQLRLFLSNQFEAVLLPRKWRYLDTLPVNSQGKLLHQQIAQLFE